MEFWNDNVTNASWIKLMEFRDEAKFVLIGGWAVYLYTKLHKSKDIDCIVDYTELRRLSSKYRMDKNDRLKKYEIKLEQFDIDIYLPKYSVIAIPPEDILSKFQDEREGFEVASAEALMTLKLGAFADRRKSIKGEKDSIDVLGLLFYADLEIRKLAGIFHAYKHPEYPRLILDTLNGFDKQLLGYLNLNEKTFSRLKKDKAEELRKLL